MPKRSPMSPMARNGSTGCAGATGSDPKEVFHALVRRYFHGALKPPFNEEKRAEAGLPPDFYWPLVEDGRPADSAR